MCLGYVFMQILECIHILEYALINIIKRTIVANGFANVQHQYLQVSSFVQIYFQCET